MIEVIVHQSMLWIPEVREQIRNCKNPYEQLMMIVIAHCVEEEMMKEGFCFKCEVK